MVDELKGQKIIWLTSKKNTIIKLKKNDKIDKNLLTWFFMRELWCCNLINLTDLKII
jgi:hypothetical protein